MMVTVGPVVARFLDVIAVFLLLAGAAGFAMLMKGCFVLRRLARDNPRDDTASILKSPLVPAVSVIALPPDASRASRAHARNLLDLTYGQHELVLVLDSPSASDLAVWSEEFRLYLSTRVAGGDLPATSIRGIYESRDPTRLVVVDLARSDDAGAWNAGTNVASSPVIAIIDPHAEIDRDLLLRMIRPMLEAPDETVAVCGVDPAPGSGGLVGHFGALESLRTWLGRAAAFAGWNFVATIPGGAVLLAREAVLSAGGFHGGPLELLLDLQAGARKRNQPYRVALVPKQVTHVRVPRSLAELHRVMWRDQREIARALWRSRSAFSGGAAFTWALLVLCIRFVCPLAETAAYLLASAGLPLGWVDRNLLGVVLLSTVAMGTVVSMAAVVLRELAEFEGSDPSRLAALFFAAVPENLGYRQLSNLWMIAGLFGRGAPKNESREEAAQGPPLAASAAKK